MSARSKPNVLLDGEELAQLAERARLDAHTGVRGREDEPDEDEDLQRDREHSFFARGIVGLRFAARAYAHRRDPAGLRSIVWGSWALTDGAFDMRLQTAEIIAGAVQGVGPRVLEIPGLAERLARSPLGAVRRALAEVLPGSEDAILRALARDDDPAVRAAARKKLGALDEWGGAFPISPDGHPREVLEAAREVLEARPYVVAGDPDLAVRAFAPLSDALAVACWERLLSAPTPVEAAAVWIARLLERPGGGAAFPRVAARWAAYGIHPTYAMWLERAAELDEAARGRATDEVLASMRAAAEEGAEGGPLSIQSRLAEALLVLAPERGDARSLLETILGAPLDRAGDAPISSDAAAMYLSKLLARWPLDDVLGALTDARRAGKPGAWARVGHEVWSRLGPDPVIRERARAELASDDEMVRRRAVYTLLGSEHREEDAGALARELYRRDPDLRVAVLGSAPAAVITEARADLERAELGVWGAIVVLRHTPAEEQTDAMWEVARRLRDAALDRPGKERVQVLRSVQTLTRAGDAWDPSDLAFVRAAVEVALSSEEDACLFSSIVPALEQVDGPESEALLDEIEARASEEAKLWIERGAG